MLFTDISFRSIFAKPIVLHYDASNLFTDIEGLSWPDAADAVLCYPYYDPEAGLTMDILAPVEFATDVPFYAMSPGKFDARLVLRCDVVGDCEIQCLAGDSAGFVKTYYSEQCATDDKYWNDDEVLSFLLKYEDIDHLRHSLYPLDVQVYLLDDESGGEVVWMRLCGKTEDDSLVAILLNHPYGDYVCDVDDVMFLGTFIGKDGDTLLFTRDNMMVSSENNN